MSKIQLADTVMDMFIKVAEGNPGAINVLSQLYTEGPKIDPDSAMGDIIYILDLDDMEIYGSHIWVLYKDICGANIVNLMALLRGCQLGFISRKSIFDAIDAESDEQINIGAIYTKVKNELPNFNTENLEHA